MCQHTWMKALACKHLESSTVTFRPLGVALKMAWSLKAIAFNIFDRLRALSRLATNTFCSSGCDCVDRGMVLLKEVHLKQHSHLYQIFININILARDAKKIV